VLSRLALLAGLLTLAACPHSKDDGTGPGSGTGTSAKKVDAGIDELPDRTPGNPLLPPEGIDPRGLACVYHAAGAGYFTCTNANAGLCFHYGAPCNPSDACMFDSSTGRYKTCAAIVEGTCATWGASCAPADACMYEPKTGLHHTCEQPDDGACSKWGAVCDPG